MANEHETPDESEMPDPDPSIPLRTYLYRRLVANVGEHTADQRIASFARMLPRSLLDEPATPLNVEMLRLIMSKMNEQAQREIEGKTAGTPDPENLDMDPYEGCETALDLMERYASLHAPDAGETLVKALRGAFAEVGEIDPSTANRRRWIYTLRLVAPPHEVRSKNEVTRLAAGLPGRN